MSSPVTATLAKFVAETAYTSISANAIKNAKLHILDTLGAALAGYEHPVARIALDYCGYMSGPQEVTIWGVRTENFSSNGGLYQRSLISRYRL